MSSGTHEASSPIIALFMGGVSPEREVSLGSGLAALEALRRHFLHVEAHDIVARELPESVHADTHIVFSTLHGVFGEDGEVQTLMEARGIMFAGCDAASSKLTFNKDHTKRTVAAAGVPVARGVCVERRDAARAGALFADLGPQLVAKPNCQGSSVGLRFVSSAAELQEAIAASGDDGCIVEHRVIGREATVGVLDGVALGVVEIAPKSGTFDYASKYTKGLTEYYAPARFDASLTQRLQQLSEDAFRACGGRDFGRIDFMVGEGGEPVFLEINTLPGLKETSLLPMSARCAGLDFDALVGRMIEPAIARFQTRRAAPAPSSL